MLSKVKIPHSALSSTKVMIDRNGFCILQEIIFGKPPDLENVTHFQVLSNSAICGPSVEKFSVRGQMEIVVSLICMFECNWLFLTIKLLV